MTTLLSTFNAHAPKVKRLVRKPKAPWFTVNLRFMIKLRDKAFNRYKRSKIKAHYYKSLRNLVNKSIYLEKKCLCNKN